MNKQTSVLSATCHDFLQQILCRRHDYALDKYSLRALQEKLDRATVVTPENIPADVVTMNSRLHLRDLSEDKTVIRTLVYPAEAGSGSGKLSVLAPWGLAIIGRRTGELIQWPLPSGDARVMVVNITYQPEAKLRRQLVRD